LILYRLICVCDHEFDSWFRNSATFDRQASKGVLQCPACGSSKVGKAIMAPRINRSDAERSGAPPELIEVPEATSSGSTAITLPENNAAAQAPELRTMLRALRQKIEAECTYVGSDFAAEARAIAEGDADPRGIYGKATPEEAQSLREDGIDIAQIPWLPPHDA
jgi:hypothetical protein